MKIARRLALGAAMVAVPGLAFAGQASAATTIPFQFNISPFGNPNGSFDAAAAHCVAVVDEQPGVALITGADQGNWGCSISANIQWINLSTGATGAAQMSNGLNGIPAAATLYTGSGQVALIMTPAGSSISTPGLASFFVP
ncbi:hypothetical protein AB0N05_33475 [Nocardia sp. NPDC051030]|uniref:hypothetical protein n=1 Tax=Nocardia sp. NPDC051030 TaxID=3155162 RepID=UPI00343F1471